MSDDAIEPTQPEPDVARYAEADLPPMDDEVALEDGVAPIATDDPEIKDGRHFLPFPVVGIGASAGGVEAYVELFQHLPPDTGMAFVVVPHLSADNRSFLPPNAQVALEDGVFHLHDRPAGASPRPIDFFFRSLAADQKNRAIGWSYPEWMRTVRWD
jgi:two-component system CheB/CheR fusion protein